MSSTAKKWLLGCGLGCGIPLLLVIAVSLVSWLRMMKPLNEAVDAQKELIASFGTRDEWVPPVDGLTPDRLERFLAVRDSLNPICADFTKIAVKFRNVGELDSGGEKAGKLEVLKAAGGVTGAVFSFAGNIGRFTTARNRGLLAAEMGLGEYIWIYVLAYNSDLGHPPNVDFDDKESDSRYAAQERDVIRGLMARHADALAEADRGEEADLWRAEAGRLENSDSDGVPFPDGSLPPEIADKLAPFRAQLDSLYCTNTSAFELGRVHKKGPSIRSE